MASESWKVVGDTNCKAWLRQAFEPENESLPGTKFLMDVKATVRRCLRQHPIDDFNEDMSLFLEEDNWSVDENEDTVETLANNPYDLATVISQTLSQLQVPRHAHEDMLNTIILPEAFKAAREHYAEAPKVLRIAVHVDVYVAEKNYMGEEFGGTDVLEVEDDGNDHPAFVPTSRAFIEKLESARVELLTMCSICIEDIVVGSEATRMPCSHFYHEGCIVEWLQKSRFCPLCRYSLPADQ